MSLFCLRNSSQGRQHGWNIALENVIGDEVGERVRSRLCRAFSAIIRTGFYSA